ncbi:hypothetical protein IW261DRAFT_1439876 [Armillaria novae-zelandiae]|uniref:Uncharacterized protein n=1 Tax=Armillaria novae-zelandiae TaxID=153914 RepID=A0AA39PSP9_9AGAR|nr:hypothetical protein IW261DRAFT_1439876 [Armillaria novae-zelandiae]
MSVGVQCELAPGELKDVPIGTELISKMSVGVQCELAPGESKDASIRTEPISKTSVDIQCELAPKESKDVFAPDESRSSLYATAAEGNSLSQTMEHPNVFSVPTVSSEHNIYTMAETISFASVDDLQEPTDFERLRQDVRGFGYESEADGVRTAPLLPVTELGPPRNLPSTSPRPVQPKPFEYFCERWGTDTKHLWSREFWYRVLRSEELVKIVYQAMLPLDEAATDNDKYAMELGIGMAQISALRLSEHATNPIQRLPYNALPEDGDDKDSLFVSTEEAKPTIQTAVSSTASIAHRSPSPFVRPSNPQSRFLESSSEGSVAAPPTRRAFASSSGSPTPCRRRPALAQVTNTPRAVLTPVKVRRVLGAQNRLVSPPVAPRMRFEDENTSPTRPARRDPPSSSKLPRWRG